jgi:hypothetical protein
MISDYRNRQRESAMMKKLVFWAALALVVRLGVPAHADVPSAWKEDSDTCIARNVKAGHHGPVIQCRDYLWNRKTETAILECKGYLEGGEGTDSGWSVGECFVETEEQEALLHEKCAATQCQFKAEVDPHDKIIRIMGSVEYVTTHCRGRVVRKSTYDIGPVIQIGDNEDCTFQITFQIGGSDPIPPNNAGDWVLKTCEVGDVCDFNAAIEDDYDAVLVGPVRRVK